MDKEFRLRDGLFVAGDANIVGSITSVDAVHFDLAHNVTNEVGMLDWSVDDNTIELGLTPNVTLQIGQEELYLVKNQTGNTIENGTVVMAAGTLGSSGRILVTPAIANGTFPSTYIMGVATETIVNGGDGFVTNFGKVRGLNTSMFSDGDILYADPAVPGGLSNTAPIAPNNKVTVAIVINSDVNNGTIFVRPTYGSSIEEDENVYLTGLTDGQFLTWISANARFENSTLDNVPQSITFGNNTMYVDTANSRVGVGTLSPTRTLDVSGTVGFVFNDNGAGRLGSAGIEIISPDSASSRFLPQVLAHNKRTGESGGPYWNSRKTQGDTGPAGVGQGLGTFVFQSTDNSGAIRNAAILSAISRGPEAANHTALFLFQTSGAGDAGPVERMRIESDGKVGINNSTPSTTLDVVGTVKATAFEGDGTGLTNVSDGLFAPIVPAAGTFIGNSLTATALTTQAQIANRTVLAPFTPRFNITIDQLGCSISTGVTGALLKLVIYASDSNGRPTTILRETADIDAATQATRTAAITTLTLSKNTLYWIGLRSSSTATVRCIAVGSSIPMTYSTAATPAQNISLVTTETYANPAGNWSYASSQHSAALIPLIIMRVA